MLPNTMTRRLTCLLLFTVSASTARAQVAKPAGLRAGGAAARTATDSAKKATPDLTPSRSTLAASPAPVVLPTRRTEGPTIADRARLAKATRDAAKPAPPKTPWVRKPAATKPPTH